MRHWAVMVPAERYEQKRAGDPTWDGPPGAAAGDRVALVAATEPPVVFGFGIVDRDGHVRYTRRLLDRPLPAAGVVAGPLTAEAFGALERRAGPGGERAWLVGVDLPIEADSPAEAVRRYWSYLRELGPAQLPTFVAPMGDELAMRAYLLDGPAALDPEED